MAIASFNFLPLPFSKNQAFSPAASPPLRPLIRPNLSSASADSLFSPINSRPGNLSVVNPAVRQANVLHSCLSYNAQVTVGEGEGESEEAVLRRFRREVSKAGVIQECKRRRYFENKQEEKKRKAREAGRRNRRRRSGFRIQSPSSADADAAKKGKSREDNEDNWEMPGEDYLSF